MLDQRQAGRRLKIGLLFFFSGMRRVIGRDDIDQIVLNAADQRLPVRRRLNRRVTFNPRALIRIVGLVKPQMVDADFCGNVLGLDRTAIK